jgi:hypothetical protein
MAFQRHVPCMPGQQTAMDTRCPLCRGNDSQGYIFVSRMHPDMSKQYIARNGKAMRTIIQAFTKRAAWVVHYLIANVQKMAGLKNVGMHNKKVSAFVLPNSSSQARGLDPTVKRGFLQREAADTRSKMRPNMMIAEMTTAEQQQYLRHDDHSESRLTALTPVMPNGNPRSKRVSKEDIALMQDTGKSMGGLWMQCYHTAYNHSTIWVIISHYVLCFSKDCYITCRCKQSYVQNCMKTLCVTFHKILTSRRVLEREKTHKPRQNRRDRLSLPFPLDYGLWS